MNDVLKSIKDYADERYLSDCYYNIGRKYHVQPIFKEVFNDLVMPLIELNSPFDINGNGNMEFKIETETIGKASIKGGYYPEGSFYRLSVVYSGRDDSNDWYFSNATFNFDKDMRFISYQTHCDINGKSMDLVNPFV